MNSSFDIGYPIAVETTFAEGHRRGLFCIYLMVTTVSSSLYRIIIIPDL